MLKISHVIIATELERNSVKIKPPDTIELIASMPKTTAEKTLTGRS
jgi:hypothetical protein